MKLHPSIRTARQAILLLWVNSLIFPLWFPDLNFSLIPSLHQFSEKTELELLVQCRVINPGAAGGALLPLEVFFKNAQHF